MAIDRTVALPAALVEIKAASRALVRAYGGQMAAAKRLKISQQRVSECCCRNTDAFFRLDQVAALEAETQCPGHPPITEAMARLHDRQLVQLSPCTPNGHDLMRLFAKQSQSSGALAETILKAHLSKIVTADNAKLIEQAAEAVISVSIQIRAEAQLIQKIT